MDLFTPNPKTLQAIRQAVTPDRQTSPAPLPEGMVMGPAGPMGAGPHPERLPLADVLGAPADLAAALLRYGGVMQPSDTPALGSTDLRRVLGAVPPPALNVNGLFGLGQQLLNWGGDPTGHYEGGFLQGYEHPDTQQNVDARMKGILPP